MNPTPEDTSQDRLVSKKAARRPAPGGSLPESMLLLSHEVFEVTRLSPSTVYRHIRAGKFPPPVPTGSDHRRWRRSDIEAWAHGRWGPAKAA